MQNPHADVILFDPERIGDDTTYADTQQLSTGVTDVWVNGVYVLQDGERIGAMPGQWVAT